jgi:hypothetical protein
MHKLVKLALAAGACAVLTGCPTATAVTGKVTAGVGGMLVEVVTVGSTLSPGRTYYVLPGSSITVTYDNGKTCTFTGETEFIPGDDGSVCQKKDNDDNNDRRDDQDKDKKEDQQDQQERQGQDQNQPSNNGENGANGSEGSSGINAPEVTPTSQPNYSGGGGGGGSGIGGPQVIASGVPQYTSTNFIATGTQLLEAALGIVATTKIGDQLDDNDHKDNSDGGGGNQPPPLSQ